MLPIVDGDAPADAESATGEHPLRGKRIYIPPMAYGSARAFASAFRAIGLEAEPTPPSDDRPHGVFSTRSPRRPNPLGLTVVELLRHEQGALYVRGVDMLDGTPILDIKPYLSSISPEKLRCGWLAEAEARKA